MTSNIEERSVPTQAAIASIKTHKKRKEAPADSKADRQPVRKRTPNASKGDDTINHDLEEEIEKNKRLRSLVNTLVTTNKQLIKHNTHLTVSNLKASKTARSLTKQIQELVNFKELSAAATDELIALKDTDLQEERRLSLVKDERLRQTEQDLVVMREHAEKR